MNIIFHFNIANLLILPYQITFLLLQKMLIFNLLSQHHMMLFNLLTRTLNPAQTDTFHLHHKIPHYKVLPLLLPSLPVIPTYNYSLLDIQSLEDQQGLQDHQLIYRIICVHTFNNLIHLQHLTGATWWNFLLLPLLSSTLLLSLKNFMNLPLIKRLQLIRIGSKQWRLKLRP